MKRIYKLSSKNYTKVIEVNVPIRFYWAEDGFDGIEMTFKSKLTKWEKRLINEVLDAIALSLGKELTEIPKAYWDAFKD